MKKFKFNYKLTISLVSLFISLLLIILGNKNYYCLSFGFIIMGLAIAFYAMYKTDKFNEVILEINNEIDELDKEDNYTITQLKKEKTTSKLFPRKYSEIKKKPL